MIKYKSWHYEVYQLHKPPQFFADARKEGEGDLAVGPFKGKGSQKLAEEAIKQKIDMHERKKQ